MPPPAKAADPFYEALLRDGIEAAAAGEHERASETLQLACFGLLEELDPLADCLVRLALAETASGDLDAFRHTFGRVLEIEERFEAYSGAPLAPELRRAFEEQSAEHVPTALLHRVPVFRALAERKQLDGLAGLPPAERRQRLETMIAASPENAELRRRLARLELDAGRPDAALAALGDDGDACLAAEAELALGRCGASARLISCPRAQQDETIAESLLGCWAGSGEWTAAEAYLSGLPAELRGRRAIERWAKRVQKETRRLARSARAAQEELAAATGKAGEGADPQSVEAVPGTELPEKAAAELQRARSMLASAQLAEQLDDAFALAAEVADAHPGNREAQYLAAEIAYRASRWTEAASYFRRGGDPGDDNPVRLFFMAVSFYESGDRAAAAEALRRSLPGIQRTAYVDRYVERILDSETAEDRS